jgi:hypothetical protein
MLNRHCGRSLYPGASQDIASEAGDAGSAAKVAASRPIQPAPGAQDYSYERELAEDMAPRPPPAAAMPVLM